MSLKTSRPSALKEAARGRKSLARPGSRFIKRSEKKPGAAPGTRIPSTDRRPETPVIRLMDYDAGHLEDREIQRKASTSFGMASLDSALKGRACGKRSGQGVQFHA